VASLDALVSRVESETGVQIVTAVVGRSDSYVELPWKAFALGASLAAFGLVLADMLRPHWTLATTALLHVTTVLGVAGASALLSIFAPIYARLFLRDTRREEEVRKYAQALFLEHGLFATRRRTAVLILVSLFERRIEIVADRGFDGRVAPEEWEGVIARLLPHLRRRHPFEALREGLAAIRDLLRAKDFQPKGDGNELPDSPIEERGA
jgi:putative membrane protein